MIDEFNEHHTDLAPTERLYDPKLLPNRLNIHDPVYAEAMEGFLEVEVISKKNGLYKESTSMSLRVLLEMKHIVGAGKALPHEIANYVYEWYLNKNPHIIDMAVVKCASANIEPPPTLSHLAMKTALDRLNGNVRSGGPTSLIKKGIKAEAFNIMLNLIFIGATKEEAAAKAAGYLESIYPEKPPYKASALEKLYERRYRKPDPEKGGATEEQTIFSFSQRFITKAGIEWWQNFRRKQTPASPEQIGTRRR